MSEVLAKDGTFNDQRCPHAHYSGNERREIAINSQRGYCSGNDRVETAVEPEGGDYLSRPDRDWPLLDLRSRVRLLPGQEPDGTNAARRVGVTDIVNDIPALEQCHHRTCGAGFQSASRRTIQALLARDNCAGWSVSGYDRSRVAHAYLQEGTND